MTDKIYIKNPDGSLVQVDKLPVSLESDQQVYYSPITKYDNYVYTIIEHTIKVVLRVAATTEKPNGMITFSKIYDPIDRIFRSYADEQAADELCKAFMTDVIAPSTHRNTPDILTEWVKNNLGSVNFTMGIDPVTMEYVLKVKKFEYVKNELFGSALEKEQTWH